MAFLYQPSAYAGNQQIPVKVVVVTMFEHGEAAGDRPGELQYWVEDFPLDRSLPFAMGEYPLYYNADDQVLAICVGGGIPNATASTMALGLDPRFDFSQSYWLIAGIAGGDPKDTSLGSAVWAQHVVDGDLLYEIDAREIPESWPYGIVPLGGEEPASTREDIATGWTVDTVHYALNQDLVNWAYAITADTKLEDTPEMAQFRAQFTNHDQARQPPRVMLGDTLAASTYWHGEKLNDWANDWIRLYAGDDANFVTSNMEDTGTLTALRRLARIGRVNESKILVLRTVSNYTLPPAGKAAAWSATAEYPNRGRPALRAAFEVGRAAVKGLVENWDHFAHSPTNPVK